MYSFEHNGTTSKGINFLRGLPLVADTKNTDNEKVGHGDELGYMFDCNDIYGNPLPETRLTSEEDLKVRDNLIGMIVKFSNTFKEDTKLGSFTDSLFKSVSGKGIPFIKVDTSLEASSDFRFCELSLFGASLSPLTSTSCQGLSSILTSLTGSLDGLTKGLGSSLGNGGLGSGLLGGDQGGGGGGVGGVLGGVLPTTTSKSTTNRLSGGLFGSSLTSSENTQNRRPGGLGILGL